MKGNQSPQARRRAFIREHHPDHGGDAGAFIAGLHALDAEREQGSGPLPEVSVVRRRPWLVRKATAVGRRLRYGPRRSRVSLPVTACPLLVVLRRREKNLASKRTSQYADLGILAAQLSALSVRLSTQISFSTLSVVRLSSVHDLAG
jgi:hypothetical protein